MRQATKDPEGEKVLGYTPQGFHEMLVERGYLGFADTFARGHSVGASEDDRLRAARLRKSIEAEIGA